MGRVEFGEYDEIVDDNEICSEELIHRDFSSMVAVEV